MTLHSKSKIWRWHQRKNLKKKMLNKVYILVLVYDSFVTRSRLPSFPNQHECIIFCFKHCFTLDNTAMYMEWAGKTRGLAYVHIDSLEGQFLFSGIFCGPAMARSKGFRIKEVQPVVNLRYKNFHRCEKQKKKIEPEPEPELSNVIHIMSKFKKILHLNLKMYSF